MLLGSCCAVSISICVDTSSSHVPIEDGTKLALMAPIYPSLLNLESLLMPEIRMPPRTSGSLVSLMRGKWFGLTVSPSAKNAKQTIYCILLNWLLAYRSSEQLSRSSWDHFFLRNFLYTLCDRCWLRPDMAAASCKFSALRPEKIDRLSYAGLSSAPWAWYGTQSHNRAGLCCRKYTREHTRRTCHVMADVGK